MEARKEECLEFLVELVAMGAVDFALGQSDLRAHEHRIEPKRAQNVLKVTN